jgi:microcystin-dependent protein
MSDPFIGEIKRFGGNFAIRGFALCDGQLLAISQNTALFSILGTIYCRDGETTLGLPDLKGRTPKHPGQGPGLTNISLGEKGGVATQTLTEPQMASHTHPVSGTKALGANQAGNSASPSRQRAGRHHGGSIPYSTVSANVDMGSSAVGGSISADAAGSGQSFDIRDQYLGVNFIISLLGTFPSLS